MMNLMKSLKRYCLAAVCGAVSATLPAQDLTKEITVEKDIVPEQRAATRLNVTPRLVQPTVEMRALPMSDRLSGSQVPTMIGRLEPARVAADSVVPGAKGYAAVGYFPLYNLAASAGYRFIDSRDMSLGAWLQFDGVSYKEKDAVGEKLTYKRNNLTLGADFGYKLSGGKRIDAAVAYSFMSVSRPWLSKPDDQDIHRLWIDGAFTGSDTQCDYSLGITGGYTGFTRGGRLPLAMEIADTDLRAVGEIDFGVSGGVSSKDDGIGCFGLNIDARFNRYNHFATWNVSQSDGGIGFSGGDSELLGVVTFNPYWTVASDGLNAKVGVDVDLAVNSGRFANIAPNVRVGWTPAAAKSALTLFLTATGGVHANTLGSLLDFTPYVSPVFGYKHSRVPLDVLAGVTVGPFHGVALELRGGYSMADDWLVPVVADGSNLWHKADVKGWRTGATLSYRSQWVKSFSLSYDYSPNKDDKGYYRWRDRAAHVVDAKLTVAPLRRLDVTAGFESRWGRRAYNLSSSGSDGVVSLGRSNNLSLGALYRFDERLSFFARCENMLNTRSWILYDIPAQGVTGLLGVSYKF